ncbi:MAG: ATP-binding cassette domain-containing protein [Candidatus Gastranaerophilaceae bacterium]|jgi:ABC-2 type transport system ATP-binding protein
MASNIVEINNVNKFFGKDKVPALTDINTTIPEGKFTGLVGPDGAGKTTLIRILTGLLLSDSGNIRIGGYDPVTQLRNINLIVGYMPQKFGLYEDLTVMENLNLYSCLRGVIGEEKEKAYEKLLSFTDLKRFTNRLAGNLSGGMKQKLGLACALISKPKLLLLDEPSVGIDPVSRRELWEMVRGLVNEGITVVWSTAYLDEAEKCDNVLLLNQGKVIFDGIPQDLTNRISGRVFQIRNIEGRKRSLLSNVLQKDGVIDGLIQGSFIRFSVDERKIMPDIRELQAGNDAYITKVPPRFEDAFIDILGGGSGGYSELAEKMPMAEEHNHTVIEANNLTKMYGNFAAAENISFSINRGEIFGLLGPNGAGKSTTFKMMCGLLKPTEGTARVMHLDLQKCPSKARSYIGYMAQKFSLYENLSVMQNLQFFSGIYGLKFGKKRKKIDEMIEVFNFQKYINSNAGELPLGYKQRLALACAVMHNPSVIFLDEPTSGVDPITRREFWTHINNMVEKGVTVMVTTHFMDEAEYCDRISLIYRGQNIATGSPDELKASIRSVEQPEPTMEDTFIEIIKSSGL